MSEPEDDCTVELAKGGRVDGEFPGTIYTNLSLDPKEFRGMDVPKVTAEILTLLSGINPDASYFKEDVEPTAEMIVGINDGTIEA